MHYLGRRVGFETWDARVDADTVVYYDPPCAGTTGDRDVGPFDHAGSGTSLGSGRAQRRGAGLEDAAPEGRTVRRSSSASSNTPGDVRGADAERLSMNFGVSSASGQRGAKITSQ